MTEGLQQLAGGRMERWLARATRTPLSGAVTGMTVTAVIRSSSATTVAAGQSWRNYRYRVQQAVIPLRNVIWSN